MTTQTLRPSPARRRAERKGRLAEHAAAFWLSLKGYRLLARRFKARGGEIDLVARKGDVVACVEVKARRSETDALAAVTPAARRRIEAAAQAFLSTGKAKNCGVRFDIICASRRGLRHLRGAWREGD